MTVVLQAMILIFYKHVLTCSVVSNTATPWTTVALQAPLSMCFPGKNTEWLIIPFFRESLWLKNGTQVFHTAGRFFTPEPHGNPHADPYFLEAQCFSKILPSVGKRWANMQHDLITFCMCVFMLLSWIEKLFELIHPKEISSRYQINFFFQPSLPISWL